MSDIPKWLEIAGFIIAGLGGREIIKWIFSFFLSRNKMKHSQEMTEMDKAVSFYREMIIELKKDIGKLETRIFELEKERRSWYEEKVALQNRVNHLESEKLTLETRVHNLEDELAMLRHQ